jgi:hypothetical protein
MMKSNFKLLTVVSIAALMSAPLAMASDGQMNPYHVPGESIDAGISPVITPSHIVHHVPGESLDAGFLPARVPTRVAGEKIDSGLGSVTEDELRRIVDAYVPRKVASAK